MPFWEEVYCSHVMLDNELSKTAWRVVESSKTMSFPRQMLAGVVESGGREASTVSRPLGFVTMVSADRGNVQLP